jgi:hypothetical protein
MLSALSIKPLVRRKPLGFAADAVYGEFKRFGAESHCKGIVEYPFFHFLQFTEIHIEGAT